MDKIVTKRDSMGTSRYKSWTTKNLFLLVPEWSLLVPVLSLHVTGLSLIVPVLSLVFCDIIGILSPLGCIKVNKKKSP